MLTILSIKSWAVAILCFNAIQLQIANAAEFPLSIIHINDFHARFEHTDINGGTCDDGEECIGGLARTHYMIKQLLEQQKHANPIYINAGDSYQGTIWFNVGGWNVTSEFLNMLPADVMTLGNHEFDRGVAGLVPFLQTINTTMLVANMDNSNEPTLNNLFEKSKIIQKNGRKIGLIGVILETTNKIANTGFLIFRNESEAIIEESQKLKAQGANIIIVISHCGYDVDQLIAQHTGHEVDVIVGAHSHTFLFTGDIPPGPHIPEGDYPTIITHASGHKVYIVQAMSFARYVGNITFYFDDNGDVVYYEGAPIYMSKDVPEDEATKTALLPWKQTVDLYGKVVIGESKVVLERSTCMSQECNLGNFFTDAMVHAFVDMSPYAQHAWSNVSIGLVNNNALRVPILKGKITFSHIITMSPFENMLIAFSLRGDKLLETLEQSVESIDLENNKNDSWIFLQVSGIKVSYDLRQPPGKRVIDLKLRCNDCDLPTYEPFDKNKMYRIVASSYLVEGGDGYDVIRDNAIDLEPRTTEIVMLEKYTNEKSPIYLGVENRITILK